MPTHIWLGDRDSFVPRAMGEYLQRAIPHVDLHWAHGKGHFNIEDWDAILAACALDIGSAAAASLRRLTVPIRA